MSPATGQSVIAGLSGRRRDRRSAWEEPGQRAEADEQPEPEPDAESRPQSPPGPGQRQPAPAAAGEEVDRADEEGDERDEQDELEGPAADDAAAEIDVPRGPAGELDPAVERREYRLGGTAEPREARPVEPCRRIQGCRGAVVGCGSEADRRDLAAEERRLLAVAERHAEVDELHQPARPRRRAVELTRHLDIGGSDQSRGRRARLEACELEPWRGSARQPVERDHGLEPVPEGRRRREPFGPETAVGAAVGGEEDQGMHRRWAPCDRPKPSVASRELDQGRCAGGVVVGAGPDPGVVAMGEDQDRIGRRAGDDGDEIVQPDTAEARDRLVPGVVPGLEPVEGELLLEPGHGAGRARRSGLAIGMVERELRRERDCRRAVERRGQRRRGKRPWPADRQGEQQQGPEQEQHRGAHEPAVDGPLERAAPGATFPSRCAGVLRPPLASAPG